MASQLPPSVPASAALFRAAVSVVFFRIMMQSAKCYGIKLCSVLLDSPGAATSFLFFLFPNCTPSAVQIQILNCCTHTHTHTIILPGILLLDAGRFGVTNCTLSILRVTIFLFTKLVFTSREMPQKHPEKSRRCAQQCCKKAKVTQLGSFCPT